LLTLPAANFDWRCAFGYWQNAYCCNRHKNNKNTIHPFSFRQRCALVQYLLIKWAATAAHKSVSHWQLECFLLKMR